MEQLIKLARDFQECADLKTLMLKLMIRSVTNGTFAHGI